jgi:SprT protein
MSALQPRQREQAIRQRVVELLERAARHGYRTGRWALRHDLRGLAAGTAHPGSGLLRFNAVLAAENWDDFLARTVAHEVAHLVAWWQWGRDGLGHGARWREVMRLFDVPALRCHRYDTRNSRVRAQRRWRYRCACSEPHLLTTTRHRRVLEGRVAYHCRRCGGRLVAERGGDAARG